MNQKQKVPTGKSWKAKEDKRISDSLSWLVEQVATHYAGTQEEGAMSMVQRQQGHTWHRGNLENEPESDRDTIYRAMSSEQMEQQSQKDKWAAQSGFQKPSNHCLQNKGEFVIHVQQ